MKALQIIQRYPPAVGGSETWCRELGQYLASVGDDVRVLTLDILEEEEYWKDAPPEHRAVRLGRFDWDGEVAVRRCRRSLPVPLLQRLFFEVLLDRRLGIHAYGPHSVEMYARMFREAKAADVVHLHTLPYPHNFVGFLAAKLWRRRVVMTPYFHPGHPHYERRCHYWLLRRCDAVFALTRYERDYLAGKGVDPARIVVTGSGLHPERYAAAGLEAFRKETRARLGLSEQTRIVLFVGRKAEYKGLPVLIDAVRSCRASRDVALLLVGPALDWFTAFYAGLPGADRRYIFDLGQVSHEEKVQLLHLADVLVLPSPFESFGIVFLEAWACGTPVIGSDSPAVADLIGEGGLTFRSGDAADLAEKLDAMLSDEGLRTKMAGRGGELLAERFRWETIGAAVRRAYRPRPDGRMRILVCTNLFPPHSVGGSEVVAYEHAKLFRALGHDVRIFAGRLVSRLIRPYGAENQAGEFETTWVDLSPEDLGGRTQSLWNERVRREFARVLKEFRPDVVHFHNVTGLSLRVVDECRKRRIPAVMTLHDYWGICFKNLMIKNDGDLCMRGGFDCLGCLDVLSGDPPLPTPVRNSHILLSLLKVDRFISPSRYLAERFVENGIPAERMVVIRNGIDVERFRRARRHGEGMTVGYVGQLIRHKGVDILLRSLALLGPREGLRVVIVGDGEEGAAVRSLCAELGLDPWVRFAGRVDNRQIASCYEEIDVLVVPSIWPENSPVTITEAMASGIPVIASDMGGVRELVADGVTGFLVPPRDAGAVAEKIDYLLRHPDARQRMGTEAIERIKEHELRQQVSRVLEVYGRLLDEPRANARPGADILLYHSESPWNVHVRDVVYRVAEVERNLGRRLLLCGLDFCDEEALRRARLLMIPPGGPDGVRQALRAFLRGLPIVVHEESPELKELCLVSEGGLFYSDADELGECLELLLSDEPLRKAMGASGRRFVEKHARADTRDFLGHRHPQSR
jgi:glycosyltransferase involved in cell wall biosynthesis